MMSRSRALKVITLRILLFTRIRVLCFKTLDFIVFLMTSAASLMSLHVQGQVVRSGEGSVAEVTLEGLGARVLPVVTSQLV